jgi:hypothetical protein
MKRESECILIMRRFWNRFQRTNTALRKPKLLWQIHLNLTIQTQFRSMLLLQGLPATRLGVGYAEQRSPQQDESA